MDDHRLKIKIKKEGGVPGEELKESDGGEGAEESSGPDQYPLLRPLSHLPVRSRRRERINPRRRVLEEEEEVARRRVRVFVRGDGAGGIYTMGWAGQRSINLSRARGGGEARLRPTFCPGNFP